MSFWSTWQLANIAFIGVAMAVVAIRPTAAQTTASGSTEPCRIVFLGDSITQAGAAPGGYVDRLEKELRAKNPERKLEIIGAGISGNKVPDLQARLERDVLTVRPSWVVIYIGINDVWHSQNNRGTPREAFQAGLTDIVRQIQATGSGVILCTPSVIGEKTDGSNPLDAMLDDYCGISRQVARDTGVLMVDLRSWFLRELRILNEDQASSKILTTDGVHLNDAGNEFVKDCLAPVLHSLINQQSIHHWVLFKYKPSARLSDINGVQAAFARLPQQIEGILDFQAGVDISPEYLNQGYTHGFLLTFKNAADRDAYLVHPAHKEFVAQAIPFLDAPLVFDIASDRPGSK